MEIEKYGRLAMILRFENVKCVCAPCKWTLNVNMTQNSITNRNVDLGIWLCLVLYYLRSIPH